MSSNIVKDITLTNAQVNALQLANMREISCFIIDGKREWEGARKTTCEKLLEKGLIRITEIASATYRAEITTQGYQLLQAIEEATESPACLTCAENIVWGEVALRLLRIKEDAA